MNKITVLAVALLAIGGCKKNSEEGATAGAAIAKMRELKDEMCKCKDAQCAQDVSDRMTKWNREQAKQKAPKLSDADQRQVAELGQQMGTCMQAALAASAPAPAGAGSDGSAADGASSAGAAGSSAVGPDGLPAECAAYKAQVEKLKTCDKIPAKAKEALTKAFDDAAAGWATMPEGAKAGLDRSCKAGMEAVVVAAKEACGW